ncbi:hypothetical protein SI65_06914 [Aspergillus cristatus]|uniref:Uncharacterized protein n=1 Tax=Aspergillus cristatus TaxID=573508 RepID=A0A1E3B8I8_ASPCR|nr:hypothetical protein SI65_06914 [Aspergillus cristatus]
MEGGSEVTERLQTTAARLLAEIEKTERDPSGRRQLEQTSGNFDNYGVHSPFWQTSAGGQDSPRPVSALGYEVWEHRLD